MNDKLINVTKYEYKYRRALNYIYIGRKWEKGGYVKDSLIANKYKIGRDGTREEVIKKYKRWLWEEMKKGIRGENNKVWNYLKDLAGSINEGHNIHLVCWCKPKACHGDIVKLAIEWMIENGYYTVWNSK